MKNLIILLVLAFSIPFVGEAQTGKTKDIDVKTFNELISSKPGTILDVRTPQEWEQGVVKGAVKINFYEENFLEEATKLPKNKVIYVYCKKGGRSASAAEQLKEKGYRVFNLLGGYDAWKASKKE